MRRPPVLYRVLLGLLPRDFRDSYREEIETILAEHLARRSSAGRFGAWGRACWDVVVAALRIRLGRRRARAAGRAGEAAASGAERLLQDLRYAVRSLRASGFSAIVVTVLAVGIGAVTTIYSVVHGVLLAPLPYEGADRIGILWHDLGDGAQSLPALHALDLYDYRTWSEEFESFTLAQGGEDVLGGPDGAELVTVGEVEAGFFEFFGTRALRGRLILPEDDTPAAAPVAVLSHRLWTRRYGADPAVIGRSIQVDGEPHRVVGVLPPEYRLHLPAEAFLLTDAELWTAARIDRGDQPPRNYTEYTAFGRIRPGGTFAQAQADLDRMEARLKEIHPVHAASNLQVRIVPLLDDVVKDARPSLLLLFLAVGLVLLVACINVASLLALRGHSREGEMTIRAALGAGRSRIVRLALLEAVLLAGLGGALGVALAGAGLRLVRWLGGASVPRLDAVAIDGSTLVVAAGASVLAAALAGVAPAVRAASVTPARVLAELRAGASRSGARLRDWLIVAEVAGSGVLLIGAGLMIRTFVALQAVDPGYAVHDVLTFRVSLPDDAYPDEESEAAFYRILTERLEALPGVTGVSATSQLPLSGSGSLMPYAYDEETATNWEAVTADRRWVAPGFFRTVGATLLAGREFTDADAGGDEPLLVVDHRLAERAFPGQQAVGRLLQVRPSEVPEEERYARIVGVVSHLRLHDLARPHLTQVYLPMGGEDHLSVVVRSTGAPEALIPGVRREVETLGPGVAFQDVRSMGALVSDALAPTRVSLVLMVLFGATALGLASLGLYGVIAFDVRRSTREIGIRIALGQGPAAARRRVLGRGLRLAGAGVLIGCGLAVALGHAASSLLFGVEPVDVPTYVAVTGVLMASAALACWIPATRATRVSPVHALKVE